MSKDLEALGTPNISKTMSAFYQMGDAPVIIRDWNDNYGKRQIELKPLHQAREEQYEIIEKELKALEIIKEKRIDTLLLFRCFEFDNLYGYPHFEMYNQELYTQNITTEEYELLKEVLL